MPRKSNVSRYIEKLEYYAKAHNITVRYVAKIQGGSEGLWYPSKRIIKIDKTQDEFDMVATFLHELGHFFDDSFRDTASSKIVEKAYGIVRPNKKHSDIVFEVETEAWNKAEVIAKYLKIRLGKWFYECKKESLSSYTGASK
jgi:hypothetical protein